MAEIKKIREKQLVDYMSRDYESILKSMQELIPQKLPEWTDYKSEADFGNVLLQLFAHMGDILSYYQDRVANESFLGTAQTRKSIIHHLNLIGYRLATAAPASTKLAITVPEACNEIITVRTGDAFATKSQKDKPSVRFEYTGDDFTVDFSAVAADPVIHRKKLPKEIPVEEGRRVKEEILGVSDGSSNQRFTLAHTGIILRSLSDGEAVPKDIILRTQLGAVINEWTLRETLAFSRKPESDPVPLKEYIIEIDENDRATVVFGDNDFGEIPPVGSVIKVTYRTGGGTKGNVSTDSIQTIVDASDLALAGAKVTNPLAATGGAERESIEHAVMHAPKVFRSLKRAVTAEDYEALALDFKGVGKVRAVARNWNTVTLYVAPEGGGHVSDVLEANLLSYFEDKRPLSTRIEIDDVDYVQIFISAKVGVISYYSRDDITEKVRKAAGDLLAFEKVDFAMPIYLSKFYEAIEAIDGVEYVTISEFRRDPLPDDTTADSQGIMQLGDNEIPVIPSHPDYAGGIYVIATGGL